MGFGIEDERPVFIVGMPRSGTTLTEQVLSVHAEAQGMGEMHDMRKLAKTLKFGSSDPQQFIDAVRCLTRDGVTKLAQSYLRGYQRIKPGARRLVDKSPHNYELLGLIALLFPKAHIIHCRRDPLDNCVAIYMQNFNEAHSYNKDLETLGLYYRDYLDLMSHRQRVLSLRMYENVYERTVSDFETSMRDLVGFLGLPWDPNCLNYHQQDSKVRTPSRWQVRQPIYSSSVERWRRYERHLRPLITAIGRRDGAKPE